MSGRVAEDHPQQKLKRRVQRGRDLAAVEGTAPGESRPRAAALDTQVPGFNTHARLGMSQKTHQEACTTQLLWVP